MKLRIHLADAKFCENKTLAKSFCRLLMYVNHALVANFQRGKYVLSAFRENKVLAKISELTVYLHITQVSFHIFSGKLMCECSTIDCQIERRTSCEADHFCYVENINSVLTRGCINQKTPLLCENRKPSKLPSGDYEEWPYLFCCKDEDYCNREIVPVKPTEKGKARIYLLGRIIFIS